jgi:hypothetical protein
MPMGSFVRGALRLATLVGFAATLLAPALARAGSMDPSPERLVLQPQGLPAGTTCQQIAAQPSLAQKAGVLPDQLACLPDNVAFKNLVSELGFAFAPSTMHSARTTGFGGFVLSLEASYTHINANDYTHSGGSSIQYWHAGTQGSTDASGNYSAANNSPDSLLGIYTLRARKGLPFGFELAGALGYMSDSSLWSLGGDIRWALLEGFRTGILGYFPDIAVGSGVRTMTGSSKMYLTTVGIDAEISKAITLADEAVVSPFIGYQQLFIFGNSAVLDATPSVNAIQQCGYQGVQPNGPQAGSPQCSNTVPATAAGANGQPVSGPVPNDGDFNNNITFNAVRIQRNRVFFGASYRYELLYVGAEFLIDLTAPQSIDSDLSSARQWTMSFEAGVFF